MLISFPKMMIAVVDDKVIQMMMMMMKMKTAAVMHCAGHGLVMAINPFFMNYPV